MNQFFKDLKGIVVILSKKRYMGTEKERLFLCLSGPGCSIEEEKKWIEGVFIYNKLSFRIKTSDILKIYPNQEITKYY